MTAFVLKFKKETVFVLVTTFGESETIDDIYASDQTPCDTHPLRF